MHAPADGWPGYTDAIVAGLQQMIVTDASGSPISAPDGFARWVAMTHEIDERGGQLFIIGNGGSAGMASHMITDALAIGRLRAVALTDPTMLTATANDVSFDEVFALQLDRLGRRGDLLIALSCSGNSANIVRAVETGRDREMQAVTVSAMQPDNACRSRGDLNFYVPLARYGWAQSAHQVILHYWFDLYLDRHRSGAV